MISLVLSFILLFTFCDKKFKNFHNIHQSKINSNLDIPFNQIDDVKPPRISNLS